MHTKQYEKVELAPDSCMFYTKPLEKTPESVEEVSKKQDTEQNESL